MSARDKIHDAVKNALIKDGWTITADPYTIRYGGVKLEADLAAERPFAAERNEEKIVVEIKGFASPSPIHDFEGALGQFIVYRSLLQRIAPEYTVRLAISEAIYTTLFQRQALKYILELNDIALVIVRIGTEEVVGWIR